MKRAAAVLTVTQLNHYLKSVLDSDPRLRDVFLRGELSNCSLHYKTGHFYFTLKDGSAAIKGVLFRSYAQNLYFQPQDGMRVLVRGEISIFERDGVYQIYAYEIQPDGVGSMRLAYEQLKAKLEAQGLFDQRFKKPVPRFPERVAIITSPTGAALQDILNIIGRRYPCCQCRLYPVTVQGAGAAAQMVAALGAVEADQEHPADVAILARGGGSAEDLWAFHDEGLARAIFRLPIPLISAVGHETDVTIADYVADLRAPTPSAAAELAVPDRNEVLAAVRGIRTAVRDRLQDTLEGWDAVLRDRARRLPQMAETGIAERERRVSGLQEDLKRAMGRYLDHSRERLLHNASLLEALRPAKVLLRGYSITLDESGKAVSAASLREGDRIETRLSDGKAVSEVIRVSREDQGGKAGL